MKQIISVLTVIVLLLSICAVSVGADEVIYVSGNYSDLPETIRNRMGEYVERQSVPCSVEYLFHHEDQQGEIDWLFMRIEGESITPWRPFTVISHRVVLESSKSSLRTKLVLYDVKDDFFLDVLDENSSVTDDQINADILKKYKTLGEAIDSCGPGRMLGDLDGDEMLTICDSTIIQRCEAKISEYSPYDDIEPYYSDDNIPIHYYSDFNRDGERDILDATCMQRYLAGMTYPIG